MKVFNEHKRIVHQPLDEIARVVAKLASLDDILWPKNKWPAMRFKDGLKVGSRGGHGIIRYTIIDYSPKKGIRFQFSRPMGFHGTHAFYMRALDSQKTEVSHCIDMKTVGSATWQWLVFIRWLHDALIEDALDNLENHFSEETKQSPWTLWVRFWRWVLVKGSTSKIKKAKPTHG